MRADVKLVTASDAHSLKRLQRYLDNKKLTIIYVHINLVCPNNDEDFLTLDHVRLVVYSDMYYERLVAMVLPPDFTDEFHKNTTVALIGYCICDQQTQGDIATSEMW